MHRRIWLLAGAAVAVLLVASSATATSRTASTAKAADATPAAAPFAQAWAKVPTSQAARKAKSVLVFGMEQDVDGFNVNLSCCSEFWADMVGVTPVVRGAYVLNDKLQYIPDLATKITITKTTLTYDINPKANWYWGGKKLPVTWQDFAYTWKAFINPKNDVTGRDGYDAIASVSHKGTKEVIFHWRTSGCTATKPCGPYADYKDIFGMIYPSAALKGMDFNKIWANCICGNNGKPVSNGPYYLSNYTKGQGATLKVNPYWYGPKPNLKEVDFKLITDTNSEIQAMRGGEVDAIFPSPQTALSALRNQSGLVYSTVPGLYQEHVDIQFGPKSSNVLLRSPWMRQAIMMGMDRPALINALYKDIAPGLQPLDSLLYYQTDKDNYRPDFNQWNYNPTKSLQILSKHCTGGPSAPTQGNTKVWTCSGLPAKFRYTTTLGNQRRETSFAIWKSELASIGIQLDDALAPANVVFGPTVLSAGNYDLFEFAWVTTPDPAGFVSIWSCKGESNYLNYCNNKVTKLLKASNSELDPAKRAADFKQADALMAKDLPSIPLYATPAILVYKKGIANLTNNPSQESPTWNIYAWKWTS